MAQLVQVSCINKVDHFNPHERITHIGGKNADGSRWKMTIADGIAGIKKDQWKFYTNHVQYAEIVIGKHNGKEYLKTTADGLEPNNLLSLPECL